MILLQMQFYITYYDFLFTHYKDEIPDVNTVDMSKCLNVTDAGLYRLENILKL